MFREKVATIAPTARIGAPARPSVMTIQATAERRPDADRLIVPEIISGTGILTPLAETLWPGTRITLRSDTRPITTPRRSRPNIVTQTGLAPIRLGALDQSGRSIPVARYSPGCEECERLSTRDHSLFQFRRQSAIPA